MLVVLDELRRVGPGMDVTGLQRHRDFPEPRGAVREVVEADRVERPWQVLDRDGVRPVHGDVGLSSIVVELRLDGVECIGVDIGKERGAQASLAGGVEPSEIDDRRIVVVRSELQASDEVVGRVVVRSAQQRVSAGPVGVGGALDDYSRERGCDLIEGHGLIPVEAPLEARVVTAVPARRHQLETLVRHDSRGALVPVAEARPAAATAPPRLQIAVLAARPLQRVQNAFVQETSAPARRAAANSTRCCSLRSAFETRGRPAIAFVSRKCTTESVAS
mmetsp:Transcript_17398/g.54317  ORF Transcript_17398/g.54317 Transcript_17398/m.54317 type:complete len:276 (+) Transcript_17398:87-914(+)